MRSGLSLRASAAKLNFWACEVTDTVTARTNARSAAQTVPRLQRDLVILDVVVVCVAVAVGLVSGWSQSAPLFSHTLGLDVGDQGRFYVAVAVLAVWPVMLWAQRSREASILAVGLEEYRRILIASAWTLVIVMAGAYVFQISTARGMLLLIGVFGTVVLLGVRWVMRKVILHLLREGVALNRILVAARPGQVEALVDSLLESQGRFEVVGTAGPGDGRLAPEQVVARALDKGADTILVAPGIADAADWTRHLGWAMEDTNLQLMISPSLVDVAGPRIRVTPVQGMPLVTLDMPKLSGPARVVKRLIDVIGSLILIVAAAVPMLLVAALIKIDSRGPVFFRQKRAGLDGRVFGCWKFRTMVDGADAQRATLRAGLDDDGVLFKLEHDPRVTRVGKWLRKFSIDELPQLFNVVVGEMSLVGPRPHSLDDVAQYGDIHFRRQRVMPGMTGLWQVSGRSDLDEDSSIMLDLYYVENWSFFLDFTILLKTLAVVIRGKGAY